MKKHSMTADKRTVVGRKVKNLRKQGLVPATIYGKNIKSKSVSVKLDEFKKTYSETGETGLIELTVGSETVPVLVHNVQTDPVHDKFLHIEFYNVDLKEKVHANVPVELIGEAQAVKDKTGVLLQTIDEVEVEALPTDLPEKIEVDVSALAAVNDEITVAGLKINKDVEILTTADQVVVRVAELVSREAEKDAQADEAAQEAAKAESEAEAGTAQPESSGEQNEAPAEETKSQEK